MMMTMTMATTITTTDKPALGLDRSLPTYYQFDPSCRWWSMIFFPHGRTVIAFQSGDMIPNFVPMTIEEIKQTISKRL